MSRLKGTIKPRNDFGEATAFSHSWGSFIFSANILDWRYANTTSGRSKKKKAMAQKMEVSA